MFYIVGAGIVLIIIGIFTLDPIKTSIGVIGVVVTFLIYKSKLDKVTKDPILFEMLKSVTDINEEIQKKIRSEKNYSLSDKKFMGIILLTYIGFIKAASARSPIDENKFKNLFYAAFTAINFIIKKKLIDTLYKFLQDIEKHKIADEIILLGVITYSRKLFGQEYLDYCINALEDLYDNQKVPKSIEEYYSEAKLKAERSKSANNKGVLIVEDDIKANIRRSKYEDPNNAETIYNLGVSFANGIKRWPRSI